MIMREKFKLFWKRMNSRIVIFKIFSRGIDDILQTLISSDTTKIHSISPDKESLEYESYSRNIAVYLQL